MWTVRLYHFFVSAGASATFVADFMAFSPKTLRTPAGDRGRPTVLFLWSPPLRLVFGSHVCSEKSICDLFENCKSYSFTTRVREFYSLRFAVISMNTSATNGRARRIL
jgi:hypothetical protein